MITKNFIKLTAITTSLVIGASCLAHAERASYIGIDAIFTKTRLKKDFGGNVFSKRLAHGVGLSAGHMFNQYIGAEVGVEVNDPNEYTRWINGSETIFGVPNIVTSIKNSLYKTTINQQHSYLGIKFKANFFNNSFISLLIGGSLSHVKAKSTLIGKTINTQFRFINTGIITQTFSKTKLNPMTKLSLGYYPNINTCICLFTSWKKMFNIKSKESTQSNPQFIMLKNTISIGVGYIYKFQ